MANEGLYRVHTLCIYNNYIVTTYLSLQLTRHAQYYIPDEDEKNSSPKNIRNHQRNLTSIKSIPQHFSYELMERKLGHDGCDGVWNLSPPH